MLLHYNKIGKIGLYNNGNTCYLNACLQLLTHSGKFILDIYQYSKNKNMIDLNNIEKTLLYLIINKWFSNKIVYNPQIIQDEISKKNDLFNPLYCYQNDTSESMIYIIDLLNLEFSKIFHNNMIQNLQCTICQKNRKKKEYLNILTVELSYHINESIKKFFKREKLQNDNKVYCENCNENTNTYKKYEIDELSENLIIHLKRFKEINNEYFKDQSKIICPNYITIEKNNYELRGAIIHMGSTISGGHYYFIGKNLMNEWFKYDDIHIQKIKNPINIIQKSYMLLFEKIKS
jgi:ubiquitin C-terminal hydrolase